MRLMRTSVCLMSRPWVRLGAIDQRDQGRLVARHTSQCLRCQAEVAIEERIRRLLAGMGQGQVTAPAGLMAAVMGNLDGYQYQEANNQAIRPERMVLAAAAVGVASLLAWTLSRRVRGGVES